MNQPCANRDPHADVWWVTAAFMAFLILSAAALLHGQGLSMAWGSVVWTVLFGGLLMASIRLGVIVIEKMFVSSAAHPAWPCIRCGYDLRGLPDSWRCPECGQLYIDSNPSENLR